jgi:hypothetical protein
MENFSVFTVAHKEIYVRVCLAHSPDHYKDYEGRIVLSPKLMGEVEIDEAINWLIEELKKVGRKAKKDLKNAQKNRFKSMPDSGN